MRPSLAQRIKRRISLWGGSYTHPDGYIELDFDEEAGLRQSDSEDEADRKLRAYLQRKQVRERTFHAFTCGAISGGLVVYWWLR
jgi:hypothetical protein